MVKMKTIETLCKCKDLTNIIYAHVHRMNTLEIIRELKMLSSLDYTLGDNEVCDLLYSPESRITSCFNWRIKADFESNMALQIFHISHKQLKIKPTFAYISYQF